MGLVSLNRGRMTRITPELASPSQNFRIMPAGGSLTHNVRLNMHQAHIRGGFSVESGFELGVSGPEAEALPLGKSVPAGCE
ncbi:hypothetical protein AVEN_9913-1 [Araneus ventricosus]|uniref:Uncharacterized protein n=1 Tax=Araneus ventricosus TaxID=182803 RepID=A0A4Y2L2V0_ARAVE|nr:hypothetical protein AVEN_9913-1 [Araneus ventricosus]